MTNNKMRRERSKLPIIIFLVILFLLFLAVCLYLTYVALDYQNANHITQLTMKDAVKIAGVITEPPGSLPLTGSLIFELFRLQATKLWWVYLTFAFVVFLAATSNRVAAVLCLCFCRCNQAVF